MREILFRGKRIDNGEWVYGDLARFPNGGRGIIPEYSFELVCNGGAWDFYYEEVDPATAVQYTNKNDEDGRKIFVGDEFEVTDGDGWVVGKHVAKMDGDTLSIDYRCVGKITGNIHDTEASDEK